MYLNSNVSGKTLMDRDYKIQHLSKRKGNTKWSAQSCAFPRKLISFLKVDSNPKYIQVGFLFLCVCVTVAEQSLSKLKTKKAAAFLPPFYQFLVFSKYFKTWFLEDLWQMGADWPAPLHLTKVVSFGKSQNVFLTYEKFWTLSLDL